MIYTQKLRHRRSSEHTSDKTVQIKSGLRIMYNCLKEIHFKEDIVILKVKGWKKMYYANINQSIMAILISDKVDRLLNKENYQRQRNIIY